MRRHARNPNRTAVTLAEVLVAIGVVGLLVSLSLPAVQAARANSMRISCANSLRQLGVGLANYHGRHGNLPPRRVYVGGTKPEPDADVWLSWMALILPDLEQDARWRQILDAFRIASDADLDPPHVGNSTPIRLFVCPADGREAISRFMSSPDTQMAVTSYLGVGGALDWDGVLGRPGRLGIRFSEITDGVSNTLMVGERPPPDSGQAGSWYRNQLNSLARGPDCGWLAVGVNYADSQCNGRFEFGPGYATNPCDRFHYWSLHSDGGNWLFAEGSVRFLTYETRNVLPALATRSGGEAISVP